MKKLLIILILSHLSFIGHSQNDSNLLSDPEAYFSALIVSDIDNSISWYAKNLGFKILNKNEIQEMEFKQANLKRGNIMIELIELNSAVSPKNVIPNHNNKTRIVGFFKIGFFVSGFEKWTNHLIQRKVNFHGKVVIDNISGKKMMIIKDPDGNRIQIFEK